MEWLAVGEHHFAVELFSDGPLAHTALKAGNRKSMSRWLAATVILGFIFVGFQAEEYIIAYTELGLTLESGVYGATFFMLTGFHGLHVCIGQSCVECHVAASSQGALQ